MTDSESGRSRLATEEIILPLDYREDEVVAAQRARFRHGPRLRLGLLFAAVTIVLLGLVRFAGGTPRAPAPAALIPALLLLACLSGVLLFSWRLAPLIDYRANAVWRRSHRLRLTARALFLESPEGNAGTELPWGALRRVLETRHAYVLIYRSEREFLIVPKRVLGPHEAEFRRRLGRPGAPS